MVAAGDPQALGQLLRSRRERLVPGDVGLPAGNRRRTTGLRREEVALLANLSATYYTFLEQGRPVRPSAQVLDALAAALRMSAAERHYLHVLAYGPEGGPGAVITAPPERIDRGVADLVQRLDPFPTLVKGRRWDVLASNPAARELFTDWQALSAGERNLVRWMFTRPRPRGIPGLGNRGQGDARPFPACRRPPSARPGLYCPDFRTSPRQPARPGLVAPPRRDGSGQRNQEAASPKARAGRVLARRTANSRPPRPDARHLLSSGTEEPPKTHLVPLLTMACGKVTAGPRIFRQFWRGTLKKSLLRSDASFGQDDHFGLSPHADSTPLLSSSRQEVSGWVLY